MLSLLNQHVAKDQQYVFSVKRQCTLEYDQGTKAYNLGKKRKMSEGKLEEKGKRGR